MQKISESNYNPLISFFISSAILPVFLTLEAFIDNNNVKISTITADIEYKIIDTANPLLFSTTSSPYN